MNETKRMGVVPELNRGPLAPEARIMPLDQQPTVAKRAAKSRVCLSVWYVPNSLLPTSTYHTSCSVLCWSESAE